MVRLDANGARLTVFPQATGSILAFLPGTRLLTVNASGVVRRFLPDGYVDSEFRVSTVEGSPWNPPPMAADPAGYFLFGRGTLVQGHPSSGVFRILEGGDVDRSFQMPLPGASRQLSNYTVTAAVPSDPGTIPAAMFDNDFKKYRDPADAVGDGLADFAQRKFHSNCGDQNSA